MWHDFVIVMCVTWLHYVSVFKYVTWLIFMCDMTHSYAWHNLIHMCDMTVFMCVPLILTRDITSIICATWPHPCVRHNCCHTWCETLNYLPRYFHSHAHTPNSHSSPPSLCVILLFVCAMTHSYVWRDPVMYCSYAPWFIHMCDVTMHFGQAIDTTHPGAWCHTQRHGAALCCDEPYLCVWHHLIQMCYITTFQSRD